MIGKLFHIFVFRLHTFTGDRQQIYDLGFTLSKLITKLYMQLVRIDAIYGIQAQVIQLHNLRCNQWVIRANDWSDVEQIIQQNNQWVLTIVIFIYSFTVLIKSYLLIVSIDKKFSFYHTLIATHHNSTVIFSLVIFTVFNPVFW